MYLLDKIVGVMDMFIILIMIMVSWRERYIYRPTYTYIYTVYTYTLYSYTKAHIKLYTLNTYSLILPALRILRHQPVLFTIAFIPAVPA